MSYGVTPVHIYWSSGQRISRERTECHVVQIPLIKNKSLCPVTTLHTYFKKFPQKFSAPMFVHPVSLAPITQSNIRQALANISKFLNIPPVFYYIPFIS